MGQVLILLIFATCTIMEKKEYTERAVKIAKEKTKQQMICAEYLKSCKKFEKCNCKDLNGTNN